MAINSKGTAGGRAIAEMREFASFPARTQRYIRRSLDIGLDRDDAIARWSRDGVEEVSIRVQAEAYAGLADLRAAIPDDGGWEAVGPFIGPLVALTAFDLGQDRLPGFAAYRFLYERLLGAAARPWLPAAFCAAAALPHLHPAKRRALLQSVGESVAMAPGWSNREPAFLPMWIDKAVDEGGADEVVDDLPD